MKDVTPPLQPFLLVSVIASEGMVCWEASGTTPLMEMYMHDTMLQRA